MAKCVNCGNPIPQNAYFCVSCGAKQPAYSGASNQQPQQQAQPVYQQTPPQQQYYQPPQDQTVSYQAPPQQGGYQQTPPPQYANPMPVTQLRTDRSLLKYFLLSLITFGIYGLVVMCNVSSDINVVASRYDGKKTMNYLLMALIIAPLTLGIYGIIWFHTFSERLGNELNRRGIAYSFGASDFWLWNVLGSLIIVGPFIYYAKMFKAMNFICEDYNRRG
ncbi:MAG: DUF4234 domain-containing protein [Ruminococcaceae bacterium]|nr:DUF4234 domain-containing protein [Oscillospiraceae bacterium]